MDKVLCYGQSDFIELPVYTLEFQTLLPNTSNKIPQFQTNDNNYIKSPIQNDNNIDRISCSSCPFKN